MDIETYKKLDDNKKRDSFKRIQELGNEKNMIKPNSKLIKPETKLSQNSWIPRKDISSYFLMKNTKNENSLGTNSIFERKPLVIENPTLKTKGIDDRFNRNLNFRGRDDGIFRDYNFKGRDDGFYHDSEFKDRDDRFYYKDSWLNNLSGANRLNPKPKIGSDPNNPYKFKGSILEIGPLAEDMPDVKELLKGNVLEMIDDMKRGGRTVLSTIENYAGSYFKLWDIQEDTMDPINKIYWEIFRGVINKKCEKDIKNIENALENPNLPYDVRLEYEECLELIKNEYKNDEMPFGRAAAYLYDCGETNLEIAKDGLSPIEQFEIDAAYEGMQAAADYLIGKAIGCGDSVVSAARSAAETTYKAEKEGKSEGEALVRGGFEFLKDYGTGKLFDAFGDKIGNKLIKQIEKSIRKSPIGQQIIKEIGKLTVSGSLNAVEEFSSGMLDPIINAITYMDPSELSDYLDTQFYSDLWYDTKLAFLTPQFD